MIPNHFKKRAEQACKDIGITLQDVNLRDNPDGSVTGLYNSTYVFYYHRDRPSSFSYRLKYKYPDYYVRNRNAVYREAALNLK
ncbi:MAG: hypothetical protein AAGF96_05840 [Bacteroidota bacterium]